MPLFSVIIPVYNVSAVLQDTLNSVYAQTFSDFEIIAVNDGSSDNSLAILKQQKDKRLFILDKENGGVSSARNAGIQVAKGRYIAFLDADDLWANNHLYSAKSFFDSNEDINWYCSKSTTCPVSTKLLDAENDIKYKIHNFYIAGAFYVNSSSVIIKKSILPTEKLFNEELTFGEDLMAWRKIASQNPFIGVNHAICVAYRMRPTSEIHTREHPSQRILKHQKEIFKSLHNSRHHTTSGFAGWLNDKEIFTYSWHYAIRCNYLPNFLPEIWKYKRETGILGTLYICMYVILNNLLVECFSFPMRWARRLYFKIIRTSDK